MSKTQSFLFILIVTAIFTVLVAETHSQDAPPEERIVYIPYKNLKDVLKRGDAKVVIPYKEYQQLRQREQASDGAAQTPAAVITKAEYVADVKRDLANVTATLNVRALTEPWAAVPVNFGDAAVGRVSMAGGQSPLLQSTGNGAYLLMLPAKGEHEVTITLSARVSTNPDGRTVKLKVPPVGISSFELRLPEADQDVSITPRNAAIPQPTNDAAGPAVAETAQPAGTIARVNLGAVREVTATWHPRSGSKPQMDLLAAVDNSLHVHVADGVAQWEAALAYNVLRGELSATRIAVPAGQRILDVSATGASIRRWSDEAKTEGDTTLASIITVELAAPVTKGMTLAVHTEEVLKDDSLTVGGEGKATRTIQSADAFRESGHLILTHSDAITLSGTTRERAVRVGPNEIPKTNQRPNADYYRFFSPEFRLTFQTAAVQPRLTASQDAWAIFRDEELRLSSRVQFQIERAGVFQLRFKLPPGFAVDGVQCDNLKEYQTAADTLTITLQTKRMGNLDVLLRGHLPLDGDSEDAVEIPLPQPMDVDRETGLVHVLAPPSIEMVAEQDELAGAHPEAINSSTTAPHPEDVGNARPVATWSYTQRPVKIPVRTSRKPTRLTADVGTVIDVRQQSVNVTTQLTYHVEHAGLSAFRFDVPEAVADILRISRPEGFRGPPIKQQRKADAAAAGRVIWAVTITQEELGDVPFVISYDIEPPDDDEEEADADAREWKVSPIRPLGLEAAAGRPAVSLASMTGEVAVLRDRALSVEGSAAGGDVESVDVRELNILASRRDEATLAYEYHVPDCLVELQASKRDIRGVVQTVISRALVETVTGHDPLTMYRCRYQLKTSERQRLPLALPKDAEPLGIFLDGKTVTLERAGDGGDWDRYYVNVTRAADADVSFQLAVHFRQERADAAFERHQGQFSFLLPRVGTWSEDNADGAVAVQELRAVVWVPDEISVVTEPDEFERTLTWDCDRWPWHRVTSDRNESVADEWLPSVGRTLDFPTTGHAYRYQSLADEAYLEVKYWRQTPMTWLFSGALVLIGLVLRPTSWENKLTLLLLAGFVLGVLSLSHTDVVLYSLKAAAIGAVIVAVLWCVRGIRRAAEPQPNPLLLATAGTPQAAVIPPPGIFDSLKE